MPAEVTLQAYQDQAYQGRLRQIFPSADRAKAIVEVRVSILNPDAHVKPEMTASVTFQEPRTERGTSAQRRISVRAAAPPVVLVPKRAVIEQNGQSIVWVVSRRDVGRAASVTLGTERIDQVEVKSGVAPGEAVVLNPPAGLTDRGVVRVKGS